MKYTTALILFLSFTFSVFTFLPNKVMACFSITDDYNSPDPVLNANFNIQPEVAPFTDCWSGAIRIRSKNKHWRLVASRRGPRPISVEGNPQNNIKAEDVTLLLELKNYGGAPPDGAVLVPPFSSDTDLSSIRSGTLIVEGLTKTGKTCSIYNPNFYRVFSKLCLFRDFIFNVGEYQGEVSYILVAP